MCDQFSQTSGLLDAESIKDRLLRWDGAEEARRVKIEKLKAAIADKIYYVSLSDVARKVMDHMQQLRSNNLRKNNEEAKDLPLSGWSSGHKCY
jgi:hypothetical protein